MLLQYQHRAREVAGTARGRRQLHWIRQAFCEPGVIVPHEPIPRNMGPGPFRRRVRARPVSRSLGARTDGGPGRWSQQALCPLRSCDRCRGNSAFRMFTRSRYLFHLVPEPRRVGRLRGSKPDWH